MFYKLGLDLFFVLLIIVIHHSDWCVPLNRTKDNKSDFTIFSSICLLQFSDYSFFLSCGHTLYNVLLWCMRYAGEKMAKVILLNNFPFICYCFESRFLSHAVSSRKILVLFLEVNTYHSHKLLYNVVYVAFLSIIFGLFVLLWFNHLSALALL